MKKRIYLSLVCSSVLAVLLSFVLLIWVYFDLFANQVKKDLVIEAQIMAQSTTFAAAGDTGYLQALQGQFTDFRITLIDPAGTVLFDSAENVQNLGNHKDRPEVQQALTEGQGEAVRYSTTLDADTYYYAKRLPDGNILRVARQTDSIGAVFFNLSPLFLLILVVLLFACLLLASILTRKIFRPLTALADRIEHAEPFDYDEELAPFVDKIRHQNQLIQEQLAKLQEERDTVVAITEKMPEGLVLMDKEKMILSVNESAVSLFHAAKGVYQGHHLLNLSRNVQLNRCVDEALAGSGGDVILLLGARYCHVFASPVYSEGSMLGAIIFMMDVTKEQTAAQARRDFSANVSHELKTPLTAISGFAEMIEQGMVQDPADVRHFAKKIFDEAKRLLHLIDDIIHLAQIDEKKEAPMEVVDLYEVAQTVREQLRFIAEKKEVAVLLQGEACPFLANRRMMEELLYNLVDNAIKYNKPHGQVKVSLNKNEQMVSIEIADTGQGIPAKDLDRVFERFYRVDPSRSKETGGTGLGLSIVKHIVEYHAGKLDLQSKEGVGTTVRITFPFTGKKDTH